MCRTILIMALAAGLWLLAHAAPAQTRVVGNPIGFVTVSGVVTDTTIQSAVNTLAGTPNGIIWVDATYSPAVGPEIFPVCIAGPIAPLTIQGNVPGLPTPIPGNGTDKIFVIGMPGVTVDTLDFSNAGSGDGVCGSTLALAGAIYANGVGPITIQNCTFLGNGNNLVTDGGAVYISNCTAVLIQNCSFNDNIALNTGGAIRINASTDVTIQSCWFGDNQVPTVPTPGLDGGAISWWASWGLIFDNDIGGTPPALGNSAPYGGGLSIISCATSPSLTLVTGNRIKGNLAAAYGPCIWSGGHGGGIYIEDCPDSVQVGPANDIEHNAAVYYGGGIASVAFSLMTNPLIQDNLIVENAVWQECTIIPNTPRNGGGGIAVEAYNALWPDHPDIVQNNIRLNTTPMPNTYGGGIGVFGEYAGVGRPSAVIAGNIINGNHTFGEGGGIAGLLSWNLSPDTIEDNTITSNTAERGGGGVYLEQSGLVRLHRNRIHNNKALNPAAPGGGMHSWDSTPELYSNNLTSNTATMTGTALCIDASSLAAPVVAIYNNTFADNGAAGSNGAVVDWWTAAPLIDFTNNIFANNPAQIAIREPFGDSPQAVINNLFWNNLAGVDVQDFAMGPLTVAQVNASGWGAGNITADPLLDATYHIPAASPARNAGVNLSPLGLTWDIDNEIRPKELTHDIGADEVEIPLGVENWRLH